jgi:iron complex transport system substrate-binding protein
LTEETTETLYLLGEGDRIVGVSGYTVRPPEARQKPRVSAFLTARYDKIEALQPDLILGFSDLQADIAAELVRRGYNVAVFNQRSVPEILRMIRVVGSMVGRADAAEALAGRLEAGLDEIISGIQWVEELIEIAGGIPIFPDLRHAKLAKERIVESSEVIRRNPDVIIASWCGKMVRKEKIVAREGWNAINAVRDGHIYEIKSTYILQPGPASLTEGVEQLHRVLGRAATG